LVALSPDQIKAIVKIASIIATLEPMKEPISENVLQIADSMGISLYQRFSSQEASLFLRINLEELKKLIDQRKISFICVTNEQVDFFGYQLLEYLLNSVVTKNSYFNEPNLPDRILRSKEVQDMTGLSRTTLWRLERKGEFPARVTLGQNSIGWRFNEVNEWISNRQAK
jgi:predicted DNA-binding transcriptional regulator AlpA